MLRKQKRTFISVLKRNLAISFMASYVLECLRVARVLNLPWELNSTKKTFKYGLCTRYSRLLTFSKYMPKKLWWDDRQGSRAFSRVLCDLQLHIPTKQNLAVHSVICRQSKQITVWVSLKQKPLISYTVCSTVIAVSEYFFRSIHK